METRLNQSKNVKSWGPDGLSGDSYIIQNPW